MAVGRGPAQGGRPRLTPSTAISRFPALPSGSPPAATLPKSLGRGHYSQLHREPADTPTGPRTTAVPPPLPQAWPSPRRTAAAGAAAAAAAGALPLPLPVVPLPLPRVPQSWLSPTGERSVSVISCLTVIVH